MIEDFASKQTKNNIVEVLGMPMTRDVYLKFQGAFIEFLENNYSFTHEFESEEERRQAVQVALQMSHSLLEASQMLENAPIIDK